MRYHQLSALSILATTVLAGPVTPLAPHWDRMPVRVKHTWEALPADWECLGPPPPGTTIDLHVALKPHNEDALIDALYEVSSPGNPKYGAHLSKEEVAKLVAPHPNTLELVHSWFAHHAIPSSSISTTHGGGWLTLTGVPVSLANKLLGASYQLYQHSGTNDGKILRTVGYALPTVLHTHVQTIAPTTCFTSMRTLQETPRMSPVGAAAAPGKVGLRESVTTMSSRDDPVFTIDPEFLRWLYGTDYYRPFAFRKNSFAIVAYETDHYPSLRDLKTFMELYRYDARYAYFTAKVLNGAEHDPSNPGFRENLVVQYAQAMAYPTPLTYYNVGGEMSWTVDTKGPAPDDAWLAWFDYVLDLDSEEIPRTVSILFTHNEPTVPREYAKTMCDLFAQLGTRGVSVLVGTGNAGVGYGECKDDSGEVQFKPVFPATCPWVTSVGGTTNQLPEVAVKNSGGGFSNYFRRPTYQDEKVSTFLQRLGSQHQGLYNKTGRGIPDIAAQALNFETVSGGLVRVIGGGTSCAAVVVSGIISLLNDILISYGKRQLGFLNPWLYSEGLDGLNDIISGSNPGCGTDGFSAVLGWDPITGLGTPDFSELEDVIASTISEPSTPTPTPTPWLNTPIPRPTPRL